MQPTRRFLLGFGALMACPSESPADDLKDGRFRDEVIAVVRGLYPGAKVTAGQDLEQIQVEAYTINLGNLHGDLRGLRKAERQLRIRAFLTGTIPAGPFPRQASPADAEPFEKARPRLRIQLVPVEYLQQVPDIVSRPFSAGLLIAYALDEPNRYQVVTKDMLAQWGLEADALDAPARRNSEAEARSVSIESSQTGARGRFATSATQDGYAASRLLLPGFMERVRLALGTPDIVVAAPTREIIVAWTPDSDARAKLALLVRQYFREGPYSRSDALFRYDQAGLRPLTPAELAAHGR